MTATLTKTERELLEKAARKPQGTVYAMTWWSTEAKCTSHGNRAMNALKSLVAKGLADNYRASSNHGPNVSGFGTTFATEFAATITEAGRNAIKA